MDPEPLSAQEKGWLLVVHGAGFLLLLGYVFSGLASVGITGLFCLILAGWRAENRLRERIVALEERVRRLEGRDSQ